MPEVQMKKAMPDGNSAAKAQRQNSQEVPLKGTLASVLTLAALFIVSWFGVFFLYLARL
ncbi:hypothetical protein BSNK01_01770 [Bacillaceae bacterium]